jgi:hypothetical protein
MNSPKWHHSAGKTAVTWTRRDDSCRLPRVARRVPLAVHPALRTDPNQPVLNGWDPTEIFPNVLFSDVTDWNSNTIEVDKGNAKAPSARKMPSV